MMKGALLLIGLHLISVGLTSDAEDFNPRDHIVRSDHPSLNEDVYIDEGNPSVHLDERCRCTCPAFDVPNVARMVGKIYTGQVDNAQDCSCVNIVLPSVPGLKEDNYRIMTEQVCPTCKCSYQRRNLNVIYLAVVFVCVLVSAFTLYILITQFIWPRFIISLAYKEQRDDDIGMEEVNEDHRKVDQEDQDFNQQQQPSSRFPIFNYLSRQQSKWQRDLHRQQRNIYQDHTMLN